MSDILKRDIRPSEEAVESPVGEETVILHLANGTYYGLDPLGTRIWALLRDGVAPADICDRLAPEYDVPRDVFETDARRFLEDLEQHGIIVDA